MKQINSPADFEAMLEAERAVLFVAFQSAARAETFERDWEQRFQRAVQRPNGVHVECFLLQPDAHPYTWKWVNNAIDTLGRHEPPGDCCFYLKKGELIRGMSELEILSRKMGSFLEREPGHDTIDAGLLTILCCPETHQELKIAAPAVLEKLNELIAAGRLQNRAGRILRDKIDAGLVRADGRYLYPVCENIPVLLVDEAIPLVL